MSTSYQLARRRQGRFYRDGFHLSYSIEGQGRPLLIIGSTLFYRRTFSAALRENRQLVFIDHRGFAPCDRPLAPRDADLVTIVADMDALRRHLALGRIDVLGHSGHGYMALEFARRFPASVGKVVLVGTGPSHAPRDMQAAETRWQIGAGPDRKAQLARDLALMERNIAAEPHRRFVWMCLGMAARSWADPGYDASWLWQGVETHMPIFDRLWGESFRDYPTEQALNQIKEPILICMGQQDFLVAPAETWAPHLATAPHARLHLFPHSGHTPQLEEAEAFDATLLAFLDG
jgi:proline iminopeptidase